ncbi:hypothetical protein WA026_006527 [Henosepilachna vigintioctopunctata]|uniref:Transposase n=1 Tax=Henosepilachna vigintioctopunctata TaxID=420089 RepID=A0AAW1UF90_9CUCU
MEQTSCHHCLEVLGHVDHWTTENRERSYNEAFRKNGSYRTPHMSTASVIITLHHLNIRQYGGLFGMPSNDTSQRICDAMRQFDSPTAHVAPPSVPPEVFFLQQVWRAPGLRGPVLPPCRQSGLRTGLDQVAQELSGGADGA